MKDRQPSGSKVATEGVPTLPSLSLDIARQPDDTTCGPTCLHSVYRYFGDEVPLERLVREIQPLPGGGTLAVTLANHALRRGYLSTIYTYNLQLFDPTWFTADVDLSEQLRKQLKYKKGERFRVATDAYLEYLELGGKLQLGERPSSLIRQQLKKRVPILTGLSSTHLYRCAREYQDKYDSVRGQPAGHFVVLSAYDMQHRRVTVADPLHDNPGFGTHTYEVDLESLVCAIMLGVITYDANLLMIRPQDHSSTGHRKPSEQT